MNLELVREAQRLVTGAEIHKVNGLIAMLRGAYGDNDPIRIEMFESELERIVGKLRARRNYKCRTLM